jgi:hypothetical protein
MKRPEGGAADAIAPGFRHDLYISYAHADHAPWSLGTRLGWVTEFIQALNQSLLARDREFKLWNDPRLRTGEDFNLAIADAISVRSS